MAETDGQGLSDIRTFRDLQIWRKGIELTLAVYSLTQGFPREEMFGMISQVRRVSASVPSNIAEGYGRGSRRDYRHFLTIARGSVFEVQTQLLLARKLNFCTEEQLQQADRLCDELTRMLTTLILKLSGAPSRNNP